MNLTDIIDGDGSLSLSDVQELRAYVQRGSPVLLAPRAAATVLNSVERDMFTGYRERMLSEHRDSAAKAVDEIAKLRAEVARLRAALAAAPHWVSVDTRLPRPRDAEDFFLARLENGTRVEAMHNGSSWWEFDHELEDWIPLVGVTHWYQVPAPEVKP